MDVFIRKLPRSRRRLLYGLLIVFSGLVLNYILEHYALGPWPDLLLPMAAFCLSLTGVVMSLLGLSSGLAQGNWRRFITLILVISIPITGLYAMGFLATQFVQKGGDKFGECEGLDRAANTSDVIPESLVVPPARAVGCSVLRYGMFLRGYNVVTIYGVTTHNAQELVLQDLSRYRKNAHTHPLRVVFYEKENWTPFYTKTGVRGGSRGPERLLRTVILR